ncbi:MAG: hypothetical protein U0414_02290 [Polyangiaceae bacterium]
MSSRTSSAIASTGKYQRSRPRSSKCITQRSTVFASVSEWNSYKFAPWSAGWRRNVNARMTEVTRPRFAPRARRYIGMIADPSHTLWRPRRNSARG